MNKKTGKRTQQVHNWTRCFCPEGNVSFSSCWAKGFNLRAAGTMACGDLLQSLINIWSGAETGRDNGLYCPELCTADITERGVEEGRVVTLIVSSRTCLQGFLWRYHSLCHGGDGEDGSCWHCYQGVYGVCMRVFDSKMAPTFHSPLSLPLLTSAALRFENSDTVVRATAAAAQPTQHIFALCMWVWRLHALTKPHSVDGARPVNVAHKYPTSLSFHTTKPPQTLPSSDRVPPFTAVTQQKLSFTSPVFRWHASLSWSSLLTTHAFACIGYVSTIFDCRITTRQSCYLETLN